MVFCVAFLRIQDFFLIGSFEYLKIALWRVCLLCKSHERFLAMERLRTKPYIYVHLQSVCVHAALEEIFLIIKSNKSLVDISSSELILDWK